MEFGDVVRRRRMVRRFRPEPVPDDVLLRLLDTARRAPSAGFSQGVDFLVLDRREDVERFWRAITEPDWDIADELTVGPPTIVLPLSDKRAYLERYSRPDKAAAGMQREESWPMPFWHLDAAMAAMLLLLAAVDEGLGGWFFGIPTGEPDLLAWLGVPDGVRPIGAVGLGRAAEDDRPSGSPGTITRRPLGEVVHRGGW